MPNIVKCIELSVAHLDRESMLLLDDENNNIPVYERDGCGWFVYLPDDRKDIAGWPEPLAACAREAMKHGCGMICFDPDVEPVPGLPAYED